MDALLQLGRAFEAPRFVKIGYAHVHAGMVLYHEDVELVETLAAEGATMAVPSSVNIANGRHDQLAADRRARDAAPAAARMGRRDTDANGWLLIKRQNEFRPTGAGASVEDEKVTSVTTAAH